MAFFLLEQCCIGGRPACARWGERRRGFFLLEQKKWWQGPGSNRRHKDFQSSALPTELPRHGHVIKVAYLEGFEPPTFWSVARRSIQLSYRYAFVADELLHYDRKRDFQIGDGAKSGENVIGQCTPRWGKHRGQCAGNPRPAAAQPFDLDFRRPLRQRVS